MIMENIDSILNSSDPVLVSRVFSRLVESVKEKKAGKIEFTYLKSKCLAENSLISDTARLSIVKLIENDALQIDQVLADLVTSISSASNVNALTKTISSVLYLQLARQKANNDVIKLYRMLEHPLVKILQSESSYDVQISIYKEIAQSCQSKDLSLLLLVNKLYEPLYLYCICSPTIKLEQSILRQKLWTFLLKYDEDNGTNNIFKLCCWLQMQNKHSELAAIMLDELFQRQLNCAEPLKDLDYLILEQITIIHNMILENRDCRLFIETLLRVLPKTSACHNNVSILILSKVIMVCSPLYLEDLLKLCFYLANHNICKPYSFLALKSVLLHWLSGPCLLTKGTLKIAENILKLHDHVCRERPLILASRLSFNRFHYLTFCNPEVFFTMHLSIKQDCTGESEVSALLQQFEEAPEHYLKTCFHFLCGMLLRSKLTAEDKTKILSMLVKCALHHLELSPVLLTLVLYELSNNDDNKWHFEVLKALPVMAKAKENVPKVIATIRAISKQSRALSSFALRLMYDTWKIENKCYSALESIAVQPAVSPNKDDAFEFNIAKAYVFKKLSEKRPELYGKDLVAHLSKILNECATSEGSVPSALALEGIKHLCKAEVIDVVTTWATLSPKIEGDTRVPVIKSLCGLISQIPNLPYAQSYEKLNDDAIRHLWAYVVKSDDEDVVNAALEALTAFSLDLICLHIPEVYLVDSNVTRSEVGDQRVVPGKIWLKFLSVHKFRRAARNFLAKLVSIEIDNYLKYVYQLKTRKEPHNYGGLPTHSIVKALGEYIKHKCERVKEWEDTQLFMDCLEILSGKFPKPLPPLDWCFLQELVHVPSMKPYCLDLASHQAILSGSARRLMENYIIAITENPTLEDAIHVYRNLRHLANSIQPMVFKPFLENSLYFALKNEQTAVFEKAVNYLKEVLENNDVQDVNKNVIEVVLAEIVFVTDDSSKAFPVMLNCISSFSHKGLEKITEFNLENFSGNEFKKITIIRCYISQNIKSDSPLVWLNDVFRVAYKNNLKIESYYEDLTSALKSRLNHEESPTWLNELFGEIQAKVADRCETDEIGYFCDILALAALYFSGLFTILPRNDHESIKYFFPTALTFLLDEPMWSICTTQILEWLHHMNTAESVPEEYQHIFGWTLSSLRHHEEFSKSSRWMKYFDCQLYTDNIF